MRTGKKKNTIWLYHFDSEVTSGDRLIILTPDGKMARAGMFSDGFFGDSKNRYSKFCSPCYSNKIVTEKISVGGVDYFGQYSRRSNALRALINFHKRGGRSLKNIKFVGEL